MAVNKIDKGEEIKEAGIPVPDQLFPTRQEKAEQKEILSDDARVSAELRKEIEMMELGDENEKKEAEKKAQKIEFLGEKEKIEHILEIAREKGLVFAINVAKKMNDPYILDIVHDTLSQEGYYKDFTK